MNETTTDMLMHYGMPRRSGRYPWGSGEDPYQRNGDFAARVKELRKQGLKDQDIAPLVGLKNSTDVRIAYSKAVNERRNYDVERVRSLREDGLSTAEIAKIMGKNESTIRSLSDQRSAERTTQAQRVADFLREQVDTKGMIDVGIGVERELGCSKEKMNQALSMLEMEGYVAYGGGVKQVTNPGKQTILKVLCPPGTEHKEIYDFENVHSITDYRVRKDSEGNDIIEEAFVYPKSMDSKRLAVRYAEDGGTAKDGVVEIRRGVKDLSLGESHYAQVRILVDDTHYIKGMAIYSDDLPDGVDVMFNTNKPAGTPVCGPKDNTVLKRIKNDPDNPFGSLIKKGGQVYYEDENGERQLGLVNKRADEGDWGEWSDTLSSQFLSKQSTTLIKKQLDLAAADKQAEFDEICSLTNPTVKKELLQSFADDCDSAAVHLRAAALPRQKYQVILPISTMKDNEVYAPNYEDGETVALIRYPHGGTFEIPVLKVNNKQPDARRILGNTPADAIGINSKVAERLSGADFDGDTVMVIPCNSDRSKVKITSTATLKELEGFDPKLEYAIPAGNPNNVPIMRNTQTEMGKVSNLITDMTLKGATQDELARAVRHSMVVIDAEKHKLDYKRSEVENNIPALKKKYQYRVDEDGTEHSGAATLISRAKGQKEVLKRKGQPKIDPETGELIYKEVREEYVDKNGKTRVRTIKSTQMAEVDDARKLSSGTPQEELYADYANNMKRLANQARMEMVATGKIEYSASAKAAYQGEVDSLKAKLNLALMNAPRERQAQLYANSVVKAKRDANPDMDRSEIKKAGQQALAQGRAKYGAKRTPITITDREWDAIQAGAISENTLKSILQNTDIDHLRQRATPRTTTTLSVGKQNKIASMKASGYTTAEIAKACGVSTTTVSNYLNGKGVK